jgi:carbonic anhydrase
MTSFIESFDKAIISRQPTFNERKTQSKFRKVIPNLKTVVVDCFDLRVTGGIPPAVAKAPPLSGRGCRRPGSAQRSISIACHLFDINNVAIVHHTDCGGTHFTPEGFLETFKEEFGQDITDLWDADDICIENFTQSLHRDVRSVRNSRGTPRHVNVYGYLFDIETGELHLVEESPGDTNAPRRRLVVAAH